MSNGLLKFFSSLYSEADQQLADVSLAIIDAEGQKSICRYLSTSYEAPIIKESKYNMQELSLLQTNPYYKVNCHHRAATLSNETCVT